MVNGCRQKAPVQNSPFLFFVSRSKGARGGGLIDLAARLIVLKQAEKGGAYVDKNCNF